jgi:hypothetical protein
LSRLKSGREAKAKPKAAATPAPRRATGRPAAAGGRGVFVQTPKSDEFVAMLGISLGALLLGSLLLLIVWGTYEFRTKVSSVVPISTPSTSQTV